jgi:hypothetical protein
MAMAAGTTTIRVPAATHARLRRLAAERALPIGEVVGALLDEHERRDFFVGLGEDFRRLQGEPGGRADYEAEVGVWEVTLGDGLAEHRTE